MEKKQPTPEELALIGEGWDQCIDKVYQQMTKQIDALEKAKRENPALDIKMAREVLRHLQNEFKKHKGRPDLQVFSIDEVRQIVDHVTGSTQPANKATMAFFDETIMPRLITGDLRLQQYTQPKEKDVQVQSND